MSKGSLSHKGKPKKGFTLPELLTVVAVIGLLLAIAAPAFRHLVATSRRNAAIDGVLAMLERARSAALASGRNAYLVFSDHTATPERRYRETCIYLDADDLSEPPRAAGPWQRLPAGISFRQDAEADSLFTAPAESHGARFVPPGGASPCALPYVKFGPTGAVLHPSASHWARLFLFNGYTAPDGRQIATARAASPPEEIALSLFTGRATYQPLP